MAHRDNLAGLADVSFRRQSRRDLLAAGITARDPDVWSGRALQEVFVDPADTVLHQCIRLLIGAHCAPSHHGYQRACDLITG